MRAMMRTVALLTGVLGIAGGAAAGHRGQSPIVPETPIVLAQAEAAGATPQPDYLLNICQETPSAGDTTTAMNGVNPAGWLRNYLESKDNRVVDLANIKNLTLLESTKHGELVPHTSSSGILYYMYTPIYKYMGDDRAVFTAEFEGKRYTIVVNLIVQKTVDENTPLCPRPTLIKVTKPSSGASGYGSSYDLSSVSVTLADLSGGAFAQ